MSIVLKCGEFMQDDAGHVVKRPGKKFRMPKLPSKISEPFTEMPDNFNFLELLEVIPALIDKDLEIDRRNHNREKEFQRLIRKKYLTLATLYYIGFVKRTYKTLRKSVRKASRNSLAFILKTQRAYHQYRQF